MVPEAGGTYTEGIVGSPMVINPVLSQANPVDQDLVALIFSGLTRVNSEGRSRRRSRRALGDLRRWYGLYLLHAAGCHMA